MTLVQIIGIILAVAGFALRYGIAKRKAARRRAGDFQHSTYGILTLPERAIRLAGTLLMIVGIMFFLMIALNNKTPKQHRHNTTSLRRSSGVVLC